MDTEWKGSILPSAQGELDKLSDNVREEAMRGIVDLTEDPFPAGSIPLRGHRDAYRIRWAILLHDYGFWAAALRAVSRFDRYSVLWGSSSAAR